MSEAIALIRSGLKGKWSLLLPKVLAPMADEGEMSSSDEAEGFDFTTSSVAFVVFGCKQGSLPSD